jgi:hypothetical protein
MLINIYGATMTDRNASDEERRDIQGEEADLVWTPPFGGSTEKLLYC